jgi:rare lipoprotein A
MNSFNSGIALLGVCILSAFLVGCTASTRFATRQAPPSTSSTGEGNFQLVEEGDASYYSDEFNGRTTSNGETFNKDDLTAAHQTLPFNTKVKVTNLENNKSVAVRINDRGPFKDNRIIDLSYEAAKRIGLILHGTGKVRIEVIELGETLPGR